MTGSISQGEALGDIISACLPCWFFPMRNRIHTGQKPSGAATWVSSLANVKMVQKEPEATQLIRTWWLNTAGFSTRKQLIFAEQFIYCWGHSALLQQTDPSTSGGKARSWPLPTFCPKHFNVNQCRARLVNTGSQSFRELNMPRALTQSCTLSHQVEDKSTMP